MSNAARTSPVAEYGIPLHFESAHESGAGRMNKHTCSDTIVSPAVPSAAGGEREGEFSFFFFFLLYFLLFALTPGRPVYGTSPAAFSLLRQGNPASL